MTDRTCLECGKVLAKRTKGNHCRAHYSLDPETEAKRRAAIRMAYKVRPELRERLARVNRSPEGRERSRALALKNEQWRIAQAGVTPEARAKQGKATSATRLAHIPADLHDFYRDITGKGFKAEEATRLTLEHHETRMAQFRRKLEAA